MKVVESDEPLPDGLDDDLDNVLLREPLVLALLERVRHQGRYLDQAIHVQAYNVDMPPPKARHGRPTFGGFNRQACSSTLQKPRRKGSAPRQSFRTFPLGTGNLSDDNRQRRLPRDLLEDPADVVGEPWVLLDVVSKKLDGCSVLPELCRLYGGVADLDAR